MRWPFSLIPLLFVSNVFAAPSFPAVDLFFRSIDEEGVRVHFDYRQVNEGHLLSRSRRHWLKHQFKSYLRKGLKDDLERFITTEGFSVPLDSRTEDAREIVDKMKNKDLLQDIIKSTYENHEICQDENGIEKEGAATGVPRSAICFSVEKILSHWYDPSPKVTWTELQERILALAIHEHSHHYGYEDRDHALYGFALERAAAFVEGYDQVVSLSVTPEFLNSRSGFLSVRSRLGEEAPRRLRCILFPVSSRFPLPTEIEITPDAFLDGKRLVSFGQNSSVEFPIFRTRGSEFSGTWKGRIAGVDLNRLTLRIGEGSSFLEIAGSSGTRLPALSSSRDAPFALAYGSCSPVE